MPEPDRLNTSGAYKDAIDGIQDKMRFRDGDMSLEETITKMKVDAMQNNSEDAQARKDAMKAIGGNLNNLRRAMEVKKQNRRVDNLPLPQMIMPEFLKFLNLTIRYHSLPIVLIVAEMKL